MKHLGTVKLETKRLVLRRFSLDDAQAMYDNWASDPEVTRYLTWPTHQSAADSKAILEDWVLRYCEANYYHWAIVPKDNDDQPIGSIAIVAHDDQVEKATVGYCIGRSWWHQGFTSEALQAVIDYLLDEVGMRRVDAYHDSRNPHSGNVMKKCGMTYEGTLRASDRNNQGICDACWYSILSEETQKAV